MIGDAEMWHWTRNGMRRIGPPNNCWARLVSYITVREAERMIEEAHDRGRREAEGQRLRGAAYLQHIRDNG